MDRRDPCHARQYSDQMHCGRCGLQWDVNDPDPPACLTDEAIVAKKHSVPRESAMDQVRNTLGTGRVFDRTRRDRSIREAEESAKRYVDGLEEGPEKVAAIKVVELLREIGDWVS